MLITGVFDQMKNDSAYIHVHKMLSILFTTNWLHEHVFIKVLANTSHQLSTYLFTRIHCRNVNETHLKVRVMLGLPSHLSWDCNHRTITRAPTKWPFTWKGFVEIKFCTHLLMQPLLRVRSLLLGHIKLIPSTIQSMTHHQRYMRYGNHYIEARRKKQSSKGHIWNTLNCLVVQLYTTSKRLK